VIFEMLRQRNHIGMMSAKVRVVADDPSRIRPHAGHETGPRRIADRLLAVRAPKDQTGRRECIDVRAVNVRVAVAAEFRA
jgi:hypothetical protein